MKLDFTQKYSIFDVILKPSAIPLVDAGLEVFQMDRFQKSETALHYY